MGVNLKDLVPRHETGFKELEGRRLGVDSYNWLYQFLSIIRQPDGTPLKDSKGRITSHLTGLFYRTCKLLEHGLKPCYVFDGKPPSFKKVISSRINRRNQAREDYLAAKARGDTKTAYSKAMQSTRLTHEMVEQAKKLCVALGVPVVQAPSEGEAQASFMVQRGDLYAAATQDYDAFLFGSTRVVRNLNVTGKRRVYGRTVFVNPELIILQELLDQNGLSQDELIMLGILVGTDYNPGGVKGIGPKKGLKLIKEYGLDAWKHVDHEWIINVPEMIDFFRKPPVLSDYDLSWRPPSPKKVKQLMVDDFEFSADRVDSTLSKLKNLGQTGLSNFI